MTKEAKTFIYDLQYEKLTVKSRHFVDKQYYKQTKPRHIIAGKQNFISQLMFIKKKILTNAI